MSNSNTPYDDAFRTLLTDCSRLIIPVVNLIFGSKFAVNEEVSLFQNESFITEGGEEKRITDSNFSIGNDHSIRIMVSDTILFLQLQSERDGIFCRYD